MRDPAALSSAAAAVGAPIHAALLGKGASTELWSGLTGASGGRAMIVRRAIDADRFGAYLPTAELPPVDLLIRTSGEQRISNFLLWELAYAELMFVDVMWPDFRRNHLYQCLEQFAGRERRFGLTGAQVAGSDSDVEAGDA